MEMHTIGHSDHTWDRFASLLKQHGIQTVVDTRTTPESRYAPFANLQSLPRLLMKEGMRYVHMGDSLGGKPQDSSCYDDSGKPDYRKIRSRGFFRDGIRELLAMAESSKVVLMCSEEDPKNCHRRLLIGPEILKYGVELSHIRGDGTAQSAGSLVGKTTYQRQLQGVMHLGES